MRRLMERLRGIIIGICREKKLQPHPIATIFAWSGALKKRGEMDDLPELLRFGEALEEARFGYAFAGNYDEGFGEFGRRNPDPSG